MSISANNSGNYFDPAKAQEVIDFIECLTLTKSTISGGPEPFILTPHCREIIEQIYGWRRPDGWRLYRKIFITMGRKQMKTQLAAAIATYEFFMGEESMQEIYFAATSVEQAAKCYEPLRDMILADEQLSAICRITESKREIKNLVNGNILKVLSAEGKKQHGSNPSVVIIDELHVWGAPHVELHAALLTGSKSRRQPLWITTTTAGSDPESICGQEYDFACRVRDGKVIAPSYLPIIYEVPADADWTDQSLWPLALPLLKTGHHSLADYQEEFSEALQRPAKQNEFRRLYLNQWTGTVTQWIPLHIWDACERIIPDEELVKYECWGGLDMGATGDLASFALCWKLDEARRYLKVWAYAPRVTLAERIKRDGIPYGYWAERGWIRTTEGVTVNHDEVFDHIESLARRYRLQVIAVDRWRISYVEKRAAKAGIELAAWGQGFKDMGPAVREAEDLIYNQRVAHEGNAAMRWNIDCSQAQSDPAGNKKLVKPPTHQKSKHTDMAVAGVMSMAASVLIEGPGIPGVLGMVQ